MPKPPAIKTLPSASRVAVCHNRAVVILPVGVNVPGDCAITIEAWPATPNNSSGRTKIAVRNAAILLLASFIYASCWTQDYCSAPIEGNQFFIREELAG